MSDRGPVEKGVILLDEPVELPEGTVVAVEPLPRPLRRSADENIPIQARRASECIPSPRRKCRHSLARRACIGRATGRFPPADRLTLDAEVMRPVLRGERR